VEDIERIKTYKDYPEGSGKRKIYDYVFLPLHKFIEKHYSSPDLSTWEVWQKKYIEPAFEEIRYDEMIENFGYVKKEFHDFDVQYKIFTYLTNDIRLDDQTRKFIGFMGGVGFFKKYKLGVEDWFNMNNWNHPEHEIEEGKTINDILQCPFGINMFKINLLQIPFWRR
jgi:hypothetical protein